MITRCKICGVAIDQGSISGHRCNKRDIVNFIINLTARVKELEEFLLEVTQSDANHYLVIKARNLLNESKTENKQEVCEWKKSKVKGYRLTSCGDHRSIMFKSTKDKYCPNCGKPIKEAK